MLLCEWERERVERERDEHPASWARGCTPDQPNGLLESVDVLIVFPPVVGMGAVSPHHVFVDLLDHGEFESLIIRLVPAGKQANEHDRLVPGMHTHIASNPGLPHSFFFL